MIEHINSLSFPDFFPCLMTFSSNVQSKWSSLLLQLLQNILLPSLAAFAKLFFVCNKQFSSICAQSTSGSTSWTCKYFSRLIGYIIKLCLIFLLFICSFREIYVHLWHCLCRDGLSWWILELPCDLGGVWNAVSLTLNLFPELRAALVAFIPSGNGEPASLISHLP